MSSKELGLWLPSLTCPLPVGSLSVPIPSSTLIVTTGALLSPPASSWGGIVPWSSTAGKVEVPGATVARTGVTFILRALAGLSSVTCLPEQ